MVIISAPRCLPQLFPTDVFDRIAQQAGRLGIPIVLWRLVDAVIGGGALLDANIAAELFPPGQIAPPPDTPLDEQTAAVLRHVYASLSSSALSLFSCSVGFSGCSMVTTRGTFSSFSRCSTF